MKNIAISLIIIFSLSSCKKEFIQPKIEGGTYIQTECSLGFDTLTIEGNQFRITRFVRENKTFQDVIHGEIIYDNDSVFFIPSNKYYNFIANRWVETNQKLSFHFSDNLLLSTKKPLIYISNEGVETSGCNDLEFSKL